MKEECLICAAPLEYLEQDTLMECAICHRQESSKTRCVHGHYICNHCHTEGMDSIIVICLEERSRDPLKIIETLMAQPFCHMHGPEHHVMVGAALLTAYRNAGGDIELSSALVEIMNRGKSVPGGACGFWGRLRGGDKHRHVCFDPLKIHASYSGTLRTVPPNDLGRAWQNRSGGRPPVL